MIIGGRALRPRVWRSGQRCGLRRYSILAIETSCDDTCISVLSFEELGTRKAPIVSHSRIVRSLTLNERYGGIHPIVALESHKRCIDEVIEEALQVVQDKQLALRLLACTRGPGMRSSLGVGIEATHAMSRRLKLPVMGVHHMQAHALTPRLLEDGPGPQFPYLSLLVSGGHSLLVRSDSVLNHVILGTTRDIAIGDMLDKVARLLDVKWGGEMPGAALEKWCRDDMASQAAGEYVPIQAALPKQLTRPMHAKVNIAGRRFERMGFSFSGLGTSVQRICEVHPDMTGHQRQALGGEAMRCAFEHVAAKVVCALRDDPMCDPITHRPLANTLPPGISTDGKLRTLVVSGGVARNAYLRGILRQALTEARLNDVNLIAPPLDLCSDNATMIAWTAWDMLNAGVQPLALTKPFEARPKWPINLLGADDTQFSLAMQRRSLTHPNGQPRAS